MKLGVIDVGGGFRDIYGAGVFDWCLDHDVHFDYCIGISAGSANLASFLATQRGRNYTFYMDYVFRKEYASLDNWLRTRNYVDLDYVFTTLSGSKGENPIDYEALSHNPAEFYVGACDARTGQSVYFSKSCLKKDQYDIFKGSCALPLFCKPYVVDGIPCLDGGISDPVPVLKAFEDGCDKVVLILTRPVDQKREQKKDVMPARLLAKAYPKAAERLLDRYRAYNDGVEIAKEYQKLGKLLIGDCQALLLFSLGKRNPQLAPGAELVVVGEDILHLVRSIAGGERGNITVMLCHGKSPLLSYSLK